MNTEKYLGNNSFDVMISGSMPVSVTIKAEHLTAALDHVKRTLVTDDANWDLYPIWEGEKRVTATFTSGRRKYRVVIFNKAFKQ